LREAVYLTLACLSDCRRGRHFSRPRIALFRSGFCMYSILVWCSWAAAWASFLKRCSCRLSSEVDQHTVRTLPSFSGESGCGESEFGRRGPEKLRSEIDVAELDESRQSVSCASDSASSATCHGSGTYDRYVTVMFKVPEIELVTVSVTVIVWSPLVLSLSPVNVCTPLSLAL